MEYLSLNGAWSAICHMEDGTSFNLEGFVPGSSIHDLVNAGKLPKDLFWRDNADTVQAFERSTFDYTKEFHIDPQEDRLYLLRFDRLDTYCRIWLNDAYLGSCMDEHIPHSFDVTAKIKSGTNRLTLRFDSPVVIGESMPALNGAFTTERLNTRRTQCTYGWDWVARFVGCGISGDAGIVSYHKEETRVEHVYVYTKDIDDEAAGIGIDVSFLQPLPNRILDLVVLDPDGTVCRKVSRYCKESFMRVSMDIPNARLWYPLGYGGQPLYTLQIKDGDTCLHQEVFGIRTVKILQLPDIPGSSTYQKCLEIKNPHYDFNSDFSGFILKVNGKRILCKGANWVPCEPYYAGSTDEKITRALELGAQCGLNMLRIWGGGTFETTHFYNECSRLGIMVTQDFLMACGQYPENEDWFINCLRAEAEYAALHMRNKPCLMWWSGDNENAVNGCDLDENYQGRRSAYEGIAPVLYKLDPYREFLPSSPYGGVKYASNTAGTTHNTQFLGESILPYMLGENCDDYRQAWKRFRARFIAEEPQLGAVSLSTLKKFMTEEDIFGADEDMWKFHTKSNPYLSAHLFDISTHFAQCILGEFTSPQDKYFKLRYLQYEWVRLTMEQLRREMWFESGIVYWMFNDCWPAASGWALVDYYNKPKDAWYAFRRCAKKTVLSLDYEDGEYKLYVSNEGCAIENAELRLFKLNHAGQQLLDAWTTDIPAAASTIVKTWQTALNDGELLVAEIRTADHFDRTFYQAGALKLYPTSVQMVHDPVAHVVEVTADCYVHVVELEGEAIFEDNCFSLMPGETRRIKYEALADGEISAVAYTCFT